MNTATHFLVSFCLITAAAYSVAAQFEPKKSKENRKGNDNSGFFGRGGSFNIPGVGRMPDFGSGIINGGFGGGYGGPGSGHSKSGVVRSTVVCKERGPCHMKRLTCPAKCFTAYSYAGKNYGGGGGGGGGCTIDCKKKCVAYC